MTQASDALAKKRFFAITAMRLMGAIFVLVGFVLIRGGWELAGWPVGCRRAALVPLLCPST